MHTFYRFLLSFAFSCGFMVCHSQPAIDSLKIKTEIASNPQNLATPLANSMGSNIPASQSGDIVGSTKDNPTIFGKKIKVDSMVQAFMGDSLSSILQTADTIQTFFLNGWHKDSTSTGFEGYKVKGRIENLSAGQKDTLRKVLASKESYIFSEWAKKSEFIPALGFRFIKGEQSFSCLVAYDCDLIQYVYEGKVSKKENCDPSHPYFKAIGSTLFKEFRQNADKNPINQPEYMKSIFDDE